jgi:ribosomal protein S18 acetylase RimI-like enzyme
VPIQPIPPEWRASAIELWERVGLTRPWNDPGADLERALASPTSTVLADVQDDQLISTAMVGHDGHRGWVYYLAVSPEAQRRGHGRTMMAACEAWLTDRQIPKLNLMIRGGNASVQGFYRAIGYEAEDRVVMSRRLGER